MDSNSSPFQGPLKSETRMVPAEWIDYNGHMNVSYYSMAFDQAIDDIFEGQLDIGVSHTKKTRQGPYVLQNNLHYLDELLEGDSFWVHMTLLDHDQKRMHLFLQMFDDENSVAATSEQLLMNVDLTTRRSSPYPDTTLAQLKALQAAHDALPRPAQTGATLGIRRKG